eukprot:ANDGO_03314.mRNA.1 Very-long-chain enoyl-CoA reductase
MSSYVFDIKSRSGKVLRTVTVPTTSVVADLKRSFKPSMSSSRIALALLDPNPSTSGKSPSYVKLADDSESLAVYASKLSTTKPNELLFRDLGPQIGWRTVFLVEYAGPLFAYPIFYFWFGASQPVQQLALLLWTIHYAKRELETLFVHRFSKGTMPLMNIFKNSGYYWGFAAFVSYFVNHPLYTAPCQTMVIAGTTLFAAAEFGNLVCHIMLRNLRPEGTRVRKIPRGFLFELVSCPNYTFEILAWIGFTIATQTVAAALFALVGAAQMTQWAIGKHRNYRKEFKDYPKSRKIIIPFVF